jgi:DME family drug/metabolite transporter
MSLAGVAVGNVVSLGTGPVFAAVLERLIERRRLSPLWVVCTSVAVLGVVLLALSGGADAASSFADSVLGIGLGIVAGFSYALYTYASSRAIGAGSSAQGAMGAMFGMGAVGLLPVLLAVGAPLVQSPATIAIAAYLALLPMFVAYVLFGIGMRNLRSTTATTITLLEPVVATILAVVVVGERLAPLGWIGLIVIVAGVTVLATARQPRQTLQSP